jgi:hypothetical protein
MPRPASRSFLLRLWREHPDDLLHATLVPVGQSAAQRHFATLGALYAFLRAEFDAHLETVDLDEPGWAPSEGS